MQLVERQRRGAGQRAGLALAAQRRVEWAQANPPEAGKPPVAPARELQKPAAIPLRAVRLQEQQPRGEERRLAAGRMVVARRRVARLQEALHPVALLPRAALHPVALLLRAALHPVALLLRAALHPVALLLRAALHPVALLLQEVP